MLSIENHASFTLFECKPEELVTLSKILKLYDVEGLEEAWKDRDGVSITSGMDLQRLVVEACWKFKRLDEKKRPNDFTEGLAALLAFHDMSVYDSLIQDMFEFCRRSILGDLDIVTYVLNFLNIDRRWIEGFAAHNVHRRADVEAWLRFSRNGNSEERQQHWDAVRTAVFCDTKMEILYTAAKNSKQLMTVRERLGSLITVCGVYGPEDILVLAEEDVDRDIIEQPIVASCYRLEKI